MDPNQKGPRNSYKIATYIARFMVCCFGILLLVGFVACKAWKTANFEILMMFGAMVGLCLGYGFGGDIWGARLFGLFTHLNTKGVVESNDTPFVRFMSKAILFIAIGIIVFVSLVLVVAYWKRVAAQ